MDDHFGPTGAPADLRLERSSQPAPKGVLDLAKIASLVLSATADGMCGLDADGNTVFVNRAAEEMLGWVSAELIGRPMHDLVHHSRSDGSPYPLSECPIRLTIDDGTVHEQKGDYFWRKDGTGFPVEYTSTPIWDEGRLVGAVTTFRSLAERKRAETLEVFSRFLSELPVGVFVLDASGTPVFANEAAKSLLGKGIDSSSGAQDLARTYQVYVSGTDTEYPAAELPIVKALSGETTHVDDMEIRRPDGSIAIEVSATPVVDASGAITHAVAVFTDISERKRLEAELARRLEELEQLALQDELTGLPNKRAFLMVTEQQLKAIGRSQMPATLLILSLEGLSEASKVHGPALIDRWLAGLGSTFRRIFVKPDICARLDIDRFALFTLGDAAYTDRLLEQLRATTTAARESGRWPAQLSISVGRAEYTPNLPWTPVEFIEAASASITSDSPRL